jgi:Xaa-Pro aminopeptidase
VNLAAIQEALREEGLDGWLFFDHHQRDPLAYRVLGLPALHATRRWYYFVPASGEPRGLVHRIEPHNLDAVPGAKALYSGWAAQREGLTQLLRGAQTVAMQYSPECAIPYVAMVDAGTIELVQSLGVRVVSSANLIQLFEARWSEEQFELHLEAGRLVDEIRRQAFARIGHHLRSGQRVSEYDIQQFIRRRFTEDGLWTDHGPIVAVNENASNPHYEPTAEVSREIRPGDCVLIDLWAKLDRPQAVFYDITWCGFCGSNPPAEYQNIFAIDCRARDRGVETVQKAIAAGQDLRGFQVDDAVRGVIAGAGYGDYFVHRTGHSIGMEVHGAGVNLDNLETHDVRRVIPGVCFSIEPGIYLPQFGVRTEVDVFIAGDGARVTGEIQRELVLID